MEFNIEVTTSMTHQKHFLTNSLHFFHFLRNSLCEFQVQLVDHARSDDVLSLRRRLVVLCHVWKRHVHVRRETHLSGPSARQHLDSVLSLSLQGRTLLPGELDFLQPVHGLLGLCPQGSGVPDWPVALPLYHERRIVRQHLSLRVPEGHGVLDPAWVTLHLERLVALRAAEPEAGPVITHKHFPLAWVHGPLAE